ncbi:MAG: phosphatidate cytidylyltransferase [Gemmatales bacterium]|nr:phosphatidate cytidylyltransferase [Gemmatales bacterium]MDW7995070.1 phosphatidate cytidylyltransferase [Gemmatales bacterium]
MMANLGSPSSFWRNWAARLVVGSLLIALALAVLVFDQKWAPWYPCLAVATLVFGFLASWEYRQLLPEPRPSASWLCTGVVAVLLANWIVPVSSYWRGSDRITSGLPLMSGALTTVACTVVVVLLVGFLLEMARFQQPNGATSRLGYGALSLVWLGVAPSFLVQLRWFSEATNSGNPSAQDLGFWALAFGIFVPKVGDIAAYFVGSFLGRHPLAPVLSPKKTWEGALGGLLGSLAAGLAITYLSQAIAGLPLLTWSAMLFASLTVGVVAQVSDLAESLVKRDRQVKDTSAYVPGLGGVLDTIDSLLFSAPVSWVVLHLFARSY